MTPVLASILDEAGSALGGFLPRLGGALVLIAVGVLAASLLGRLTTRLLRAARLDELAERWGVHDTLERAGLPRSLAAITGRAIRIGLVVVVVFAALSLLGLQFLSDALNQAILFLPRILAAGALLLAGIVLGGLLRARIDRLAREMDLRVPLGRAAQILVIVVFALTAAAQVALTTAILLLLLAIVVTGAIAVPALAFGLGGREIARALSSGYYVRGIFEVGQTITVEGQRGRIRAIETTTTVLDTEDGVSLHVPNHVLLESIVTRHEPVGDAAGQDA